MGKSVNRAEKTQKLVSAGVLALLAELREAAAEMPWDPPPWFKQPEEAKFIQAGSRSQISKIPAHTFKLHRLKGIPYEWTSQQSGTNQYCCC